MASVADLVWLMTAFRVSQALFVVSELGVAELLADGPKPIAELADRTDSDADALSRVLRLLVHEGVFEERESRVFALTPLGEQLPSLRAQARYLSRPYQWNVWTDLLHSVRTGTSAFEHQHGRTAWAYRADHLKEAAIFDDWMTTQTSLQNAAIVAGYDWRRFSHIVDVGGGHGALLVALLDADPALRGTLFDQPQVVSAVRDHDRLDVVGGSFFDAVPHGGDAYVLKSVVHDWPDDDAVAILVTVATALQGNARVLLVERDLADRATASLDLQMLVMFGSRERSPEEYAALVEAAGLRYVGVTPVGAGFAVFEARR